MADIKMEAEHFSPYRADGKLVSWSCVEEEGNGRGADERSMASFVWLLVLRNLLDRLLSRNWLVC